MIKGNLLNVDGPCGEAYNFAFFTAGGLNAKYVLKVDCDTRLHPRFFARNDLRTRADIEPEVGFINADHSQQRDKNDVHINGIFVATSNHVSRVNGGAPYLSTRQHVFAQNRRLA